MTIGVSLVVGSVTGCPVAVTSMLNLDSSSWYFCMTDAAALPRMDGCFNAACNKTGIERHLQRNNDIPGYKGLL